MLKVFVLISDDRRFFSGVYLEILLRTCSGIHPRIMFKIPSRIHPLLLSLSKNIPRNYFRDSTSYFFRNLFKIFSVHFEEFWWATLYYKHIILIFIFFAHYSADSEAYHKCNPRTLNRIYLKFVLNILEAFENWLPRLCHVKKSEPLA